MALETRNTCLPRTDQRVGTGQLRAVWGRSFTWLLVVSTVGGLALGCSGDTTGPTPLSPTQTYWVLRLNYHAVNMATVAPYNTVQLTATPLNTVGDSLPGLGSATYTAADSSVTVSPTGLVTARYTTPGTFVVATLQNPKRNLTNADTVFIQVTDTVPQHPLATFSIQPPSGDSAKRAIDFNPGGTVFWPVSAADAVGDIMCTSSVNFYGGYQPTCALQVYFTSSDPTVASIGRTDGSLTLRRPGHVTFYATTMAYGVTKRDSLPFVIGWPMGAVISSLWITPVAGLTPVLSFSPPKIEVGIGADVRWPNQFGGPTPGDSVDVVFDDSTAVQPGCGVFFGEVQNCNSLTPPTGGGNIPPFAPDTAARSAGDFVTYFHSIIRGRTFPIAGTYTYHSRRYPSATGKIVVRTDP